MIITIDLPPDVEASVRTQAVEAGLSLENYITTIVREGAQRRERIDLLAEKSFDEILAPIRRGFQDSGMSDEELGDLFTGARKEASRLRNKRT